MTGPRRGRDLRLVPTGVEHYEALHRGLHRPEVAAGFRWRGEPVPAARFEEALLDRASLSWSVVDDDDRVTGLVQLLNVNAADGFGDLVAAQFDPERRSTFAGAVVLAIDEAFRQRNLRKLYLQLTERSAAAFPLTIDRFLEIEGRLRGHVWLEGRHQDVVIASITPDRLASQIEAHPWFRGASEDGWFVLEGRTVSEPAGGGFQEVVTTLCGGQLDPSRPLLELLSDSLALLEVMVALDEVAGREVAAEAVLALDDVGGLLRLADSLAPSTHDALAGPG